MAYTYDLTTPAGQIRLLTSDVSPSNGAADPKDYVFEDAELSAFYSLAGSNLYEAAATAAETWARVRGFHQSEALRNADSSSLRRFSPRQLLELAQRIRELPLRGTLQTGSIDSGGAQEFLEEMWPQWRGFSDPPVVE